MKRLLSQSNGENYSETKVGFCISVELQKGKIEA